VEIRPVNENFVAVVGGVDLARPLDRRQIEEIEAAIAKYAVLVFRGQKLDNETQPAFARQFGQLEQSSQVYRKDRVHRIAQAEISDVSNLDADNRPRAKDDKRRLEAFSNRLWHSDASFRAVTGALSMLYAHAVPSSGGETEFADLRGAHDALAQATKDKIEGLYAVHDHSYSREKMGFSEASAEQRSALPPVRHPLVRTATRSGRKSLYLGSHASHIDGWPVPEGRILLTDLLEAATQREFVYRHHWMPGDLVIWDNHCTLHRGREFDETQARDLRRVTTRDQQPEALPQAG
jgi:alpha-ketoglutarate-dependent 2,4-dichlorophenoxyacetate dioxygenase